MIREEMGQLKLDKYGQVTVVHGEQEYRFYEDYREPFPLYPNEVVVKKDLKLEIVLQNTAIKLEALRSFTDPKTKLKREAGDQWLLEVFTSH